MRIRLRQSQSGIALIIVLIVIIVLGVLATEFASSMRVETKLARDASFEADLEWMARSAVERAKWILSLESGGPQGQSDSLVMRTFGGPGRTNDLVSTLPIKGVRHDNGEFDVTVIDLDRKININAAARDKMVMQEALSFVGIEDGALTSTISDSIADWVDPDDNSGVSGAESSDYTSSPNPGYPPYRAKNGPIDDLSELLMVRGVTPAIYWGPKAGVYSTMRKRHSGFEEPEYHVGLHDIFTALSGGKVNINTTDERLLQALVGVDAMMATELIRARKGLDQVDGTPDDINDINMLLQMANIPQELRAVLAQQLTMRSLIFEVTVDVHFGSIRKQYVAIIRRNGPRDIQTLSMYSR
jgi:general secretion pathway protein K